MSSTLVKWGRRAAIIPVAVAAYIAVAGLTGFCPNCANFMDSVLGRSHTPITPGSPRGSITTLAALDFDGQPVSLAQYLGKPTIIDVWATWCPPCRQQRDVIHNLDPDFLSSVNIVSLSTDRSPADVAAFLAKHPSNITDLMATSDTLRAFGGVTAIPTLVFVDPSGQIRDVSTGVHSSSELRRRVLGLTAN
ncbi:MAG: TlpA family protein disulfide reductase [Phycisphaerales bacterium]